MPTSAPRKSGPRRLRRNFVGRNTGAVSRLRNSHRASVLNQQEQTMSTTRVIAWFTWIAAVHWSRRVAVVSKEHLSKGVVAMSNAFWRSLPLVLLLAVSASLAHPVFAQDDGQADP